MRLFFKKPKIELFVRHCHFSDISQHKKRLPNWTRERCFENLLATVDPRRVNVTILLDTFHPMKETHFVKKQTRYPVLEITEGTEAGSFLKMLDHVLSKKFSPDTIIYFLEDDYIHRAGWVDVLLEAFSLPDVDYVTLYDHKDKYFLPLYTDLHAKLFHTKSVHWRTTPSTTNTYAMRFKTLQEHLPVHRAFSEGRKISLDHDKFCKLHEMGARLISPIPGWATHTEIEFASPCVEWHNLH